MDESAFILILGMHRSGTSCLAGSLELCGLHLGAVRRNGVHNAKGYFELKVAERLHDQILGLNGGSWHSPPDRIRVHPYHQQQISRIANELSEFRPCGVKDPRLLLFLEVWSKAIEPPVRFVGTFRHPLAVARSLMHRNRIDRTKAIALWLRYNTALVDLHRKKPFPIVEYDVTSADNDYRRQIESVALDLGLQVDTASIDAFVTPELGHYNVGEEPVPEQCKQVWDYLQNHRVIKQEFQPSPRVTSQAPRLRSPMMEQQFATIRNFLLFVGNARSGTTIVRSLLNAHPNAVVSNEVNVLSLIEAGWNWPRIFAEILRNVDHFDRHPVWNAYLYRVPESPRSGGIQLIGDKKAAGTTSLILENSQHLESLQQRIPAPLRFIHCVRAPLDVIATKTRRSGRPLLMNLQRYFELEGVAAEMFERFPGQCIRVSHESLIDDPAATLKMLFDFLELPIVADDIERSCSIIRKAPNHSRYDINWSTEVLAEAERRTGALPHLEHYLDDGMAAPALDVPPVKWSAT